MKESNSDELEQEKILEEAQNQLREAEEKIKEDTNNSLYQNVVIYLTDDEGNVKVKGTMKYETMLALENFQGIDFANTIGMLFSALEDELKNKQNGTIDQDKK